MSDHCLIILGDVDEIKGSTETLKFFVWFEDEDCIVVTIKADDLKQSNEDYESRIQDYIFERYGRKLYDIVEIDSCEHVEL